MATDTARRDCAGAGRALGQGRAPRSSRGSGTSGRRVCGSVGTEAAVGPRGRQDGDFEREDLDPHAPGLQEASSERSLIGGPEQEKECGAASVVVRTFCGRIYRSHRDGELPVSGPRPRGRQAGLGRTLRGVRAWVRGGRVCARLVGLAAAIRTSVRRLWRRMPVMGCGVVCLAWCVFVLVLFVLPTCLEGVTGRAVDVVGLRSPPAAGHGLRRKGSICNSQNRGLPGSSSSVGGSDEAAGAGG